MVTVYSEGDNPRLHYTLEVIFHRCLGTSFRLLNDWDEFVRSPEPRLNYSSKIDPGYLRILPHRLLFESHIEEQTMEMGLWRNIPCFYVTDAAAVIPFDIFAASFFLLSRYEEYTCREKDQHGRFPSSSSLAVREGLLERPLVNEWAQALGQLIGPLAGNINIEPPSFRFISTIDVDMAYSYRHKGFRRTLGAVARDLGTLKLYRLQQRLSVLRGRKKDPFDNFDEQKRLHREYLVNRMYFILLGEHGKYDKNTSPGKPAFIDLIQRLSKENTVGIHPSYASNDGEGRRIKEIHRLETITHKKVNHSRQHFLRFDIRKTFPALEKEGIREEFSMGYSDRVGFRAGVCVPYPFFNLPRNEVGNLLLHPFVVMDVALMRFMKLRPILAMQKIAELIEKVRAVNGVFISVFHNESLSDADEWQGWLEVYEEMLKLASENHDTAHTA